MEQDFIIIDGVLESYVGPGGDVIIPDGVTTIGEKAFNYCKLTSVTIPSGVTTIKERAFDECKCLKQVKIPDSVTTIERCAFRFCISLKIITIPKSVITIEPYTFAYSGLNKITLPYGLTMIGTEAFFGSELTSITIPETVTKIGRRAFSGCRLLKTVIFKKDIAGSGPEAFFGSAIKEYIVEDSKKYYSKDGVIYNNSGKKIVIYASGKKETEFIIPENVESVGAHVFDNGEKDFPHLHLKVVWIPKNVRAISTTSFSNLYVVFYNSEFGDKLKKAIPIYISGSIDDLPSTKKPDAIEGWLYARKNGIHEIDNWDHTYIDYLKRNEKTYVKQALMNENKTLLHIMIENKAISLKLAQEVIRDKKITKNKELTAAFLQYIKSFDKKSTLIDVIAEEERDMQRKVLMQQRKEEIQKQKGIKGITFVATGDMENFGSQDYYTSAKDWSDLKEYIEKRGGYLRSSVSSKTDYLICNDPNSNSKKSLKAKELGVSIISEEEFLTMADNNVD